MSRGTGEKMTVWLGSVSRKQGKRREPSCREVFTAGDLGNREKHNWGEQCNEWYRATADSMKTHWSEQLKTHKYINFSLLVIARKVFYYHEWKRKAHPLTHDYKGTCLGDKLCLAYAMEMHEISCPILWVLLLSSPTSDFHLVECQSLCSYFSKYLVEFQSLDPTAQQQWGQRRNDLLFDLQSTSLGIFPPSCLELLIKDCLPTGPSFLS